MKVLIALDGSRPSRHAVDEVLRLLRGVLEHAEVWLVDIIPRISPYELVDTGLAPAAAETELIKEEAADAESELQWAHQRLEDAGVAARRVEGLDDPVAGILAIARELRPDLLVMGTHGRGPLMRLLKGSVSEAVLHHWQGPVFLVHQ